MKPLLYEIVKDSFDAAFDRTINFTWSGNQAQKNRVRIYNNETLSLVYDNVQTSHKLAHVIPGNTLQNGVTYKITVAVIVFDETESEQSDPILFTCYSTPSYAISGVTNNQIIQASSYAVGLQYTQPENTPLQQFNVFLLNYNKEVIFTTGTQYATENISVLLTNLEDDHVYTVYATGVIGNNMEIKTPSITFTVNYTHNEGFVICNTLNVKDIGAIRIESNIVTRDGIVTGDEIYFDDSTIDLRDSTVTYDDLDIKNDFDLVLKIKYEDTILNKTFLQIFGENLVITTAMYSKYVDITQYISGSNSSGASSSTTYYGGDSSTQPSEYTIILNGLGSVKYTRLLGYYFETAINLNGIRFIFHSDVFEKPDYLDEIFLWFKIKDKNPGFWELGCKKI